MKIGRNVKVFVVGRKKEDSEVFADEIMQTFNWIKKDRYPWLLENLHAKKIGRQICDEDGNALKIYATAAVGNWDDWRKMQSDCPDDRLDGLPYFGLHKRDFSERVLIINLWDHNLWAYLLRSTFRENQDQIMPYVFIDGKDLEQGYRVVAECIMYGNNYDVKVPGLSEWSHSAQEALVLAQLPDEEFSGREFYNVAMTAMEDPLRYISVDFEKMAHIFLLSSLLLATEVNDSEADA